MDSGEGPMKKPGDVAVPYLPAEIISEVLSFLPVRSLFRFRCVSKSFLSLISNPNFIKQHLDRNKQQTERLFLLSDKYEYYNMVTLKKNNCYNLDLGSPNLTVSPVLFGSRQNPLRFTNILGSCDGLLLLSDDCLYFFVVNPSTREFRELPDAPLSINSTNCNDRYGFGFDSSRNDYKVVIISFETSDSVGNLVGVYDLRADSWRMINSCPYEIDEDTNPNGVVLNGALHWLCDAGIFTFNLANENFSCLSFPSNGDQDFKLDLLGVIQGCLSGVDYSDGVNVWVMEEYGVKDSWKRFSVYCSDSVIESALPLRTGKVLLNVGTGLVLYDLKKEECERLEVQGYQTFFIEVSYEESLLQLRRRD